MFISKVKFNKSNMASMSNTYKMHQNVFNIVSDDKNSCRDFIYRIYENDGYAIILSKQEPCGTMLKNLEIQTKKFSPQLVNGKEYQFSVKFASVKRVNNKEKAVLDKNESIELLNKKLIAADAGSIISAESDILGFETVKKHESSFDIPTAQLKGIIKVNNADKMLDILNSGIGRKKGFGFGLLMLRNT